MFAINNLPNDFTAEMNGLWLEYILFCSQYTNHKNFNVVETPASPAFESVDLNNFLYSSMRKLNVETFNEDVSFNFQYSFVSNQIDLVFLET